MKASLNLNLLRFQFATNLIEYNMLIRCMLNVVFFFFSCAQNVSKSGNGNLSDNYSNMNWLFAQIRFFVRSLKL